MPYTLTKQSQSSSDRLRNLAVAITQTFENNSTLVKYDKVEVVDGRGYTAGMAGFTTGTGDALLVIEEWNTRRSRSFFSSFFVSDLTSYIPRLRALASAYEKDGYTPVFSPLILRYQTFLVLKASQRLGLLLVLTLHSSKPSTPSTTISTIFLLKLWLLNWASYTLYPEL